MQNGQTCYTIWTANGISEAEFYALNPNVDCAKLQAGQSLCVAGSTTCSKTHTVVSGDTCAAFPLTNASVRVGSTVSLLFPKKLTLMRRVHWGHQDDVLLPGFQAHLEIVGLHACSELHLSSCPYFSHCSSTYWCAQVLHHLDSCRHHTGAASCRQPRTRLLQPPDWPGIRAEAHLFKTLHFQHHHYRAASHLKIF